MISVVIPVYRVERYLEKCLDSVLNQTFKDLEIILVDDGSPDRCPEICDEYAKCDERIKVIHKNNGGLSSARNAGIEKASGEWISFIDSDDYIANDMLENLFNAASNAEADISMCNFLCIDTDGNTSRFLEDRKLLENEIITGHEALLRLFDKGHVCYTIAWNKLYRHKLFESIRYPEGKIHEDEFVIHHLYALARKVVCIDYTGYFYVQRAGSIMSERGLISKICTKEALLDRFRLTDKIGEYSLATYNYYLEFLRCAEMCYQYHKREEKMATFRLYKEYRNLSYLRRHMSINNRIHYDLVYLTPIMQILMINMSKGTKLKG